jgi:hypothetical protein
VTSSGARVPSGSPASTAPRPEAEPDAAEDLRLARLHVRVGMHATARAELEDLGGRAALDLDGIAALAEARWRTGDLDGAADAADAHLAAGGRDPIAIVIAAEAAALAGEGTDARALVERLGTTDPATIEAIFAGIPRRAHWPSATLATAEGQAGGPATAPGADSSEPPIRGSAVPGPADVLRSNAGLWADEPSPKSPAANRASRPAPTWVEPARAKGHADPEQELELARDELETAPDRGLLRLALVLRLDPTLAPDVLDLVRRRREPAAVLLRGDAERLLGRHLEAEAAFADAIELIERQVLASRPAADRITHAQAAAEAGSGHHDEPDRQEDS